MYNYKFKVLLLGESGVGKSSLISRFLTNLYLTSSKNTIGVEFYVKSLIIDDKKVKLELWDLSRKERFRFLVPRYCRNTEGALFIYDITNKASLYEIDNWLDMIKKEIKGDELFPIIVVGNKADLESKRLVSTEEGIRIAKLGGLDGFIECSAETGENIEELFEALARLMMDA